VSTATEDDSATAEAIGLHIKLVVACSEDRKARRLSYLIASWNYDEARISTSGKGETRFLPIKRHLVAGVSGYLEGDPLLGPTSEEPVSRPQSCRGLVQFGVDRSCRRSAAPAQRLAASIPAETFD
jgi:hypothetical protein